MSKENIKKAVDNFEQDNFVDSEEALKKEIKRAKNDYLKKELGLENDIEEIESDNDDDGNNDDNDENSDNDSVSDDDNNSTD